MQTFPITGVMNDKSALSGAEKRKEVGHRDGKRHILGCPWSATPDGAAASHRTVLKDAPLSLNVAVRARSVHDDFFEAAHRALSTRCPNVRCHWRLASLQVPFEFNGASPNPDQDGVQSRLHLRQ